MNAYTVTTPAGNTVTIYSPIRHGGDMTVPFTHHGRPGEINVPFGCPSQIMWEQVDRVIASWGSVVKVAR